jgi:hypothetical protein
MYFDKTCSKHCFNCKKKIINKEFNIINVLLLLFLIFICLFYCFTILKRILKKKIRLKISAFRIKIKWILYFQSFNLNTYRMRVLVCVVIINKI